MDTNVISKGDWALFVVVIGCLECHLTIKRIITLMEAEQKKAFSEEKKTAAWAGRQARRTQQRLVQVPTRELHTTTG